MSESDLRIAVIGSGAAGIIAAYLLQRKFKVTLFEKNGYLGGHVHTVVIPDGPDAGTPVDTGFIVMNDRNYPLFRRFLDELGVKTRNSDMSFSFSCRTTGMEYKGSNLNGLFAKRRNLVNPTFWKMLLEIRRFFRQAPLDLKANKLRGVSLGDYLKQGKYLEVFIQDHILPMASAIWSSPPGKILEFPSEAFVRFFVNHGLLTWNDRPQWQTIVGGSHSYIKAFAQNFSGDVRLNTPVMSVTRKDDGVLVKTTGNNHEKFDHVVLAVHGDEALKLLADPTQDEEDLLTTWRYQENHVVLHTDTDIMPANRRVWASWNYIREFNDTDQHPVSVTYDMNNLQGLSSRHRYLVTLNSRREIDNDHFVGEFLYTHPCYTQVSLSSQKALGELSGLNRTSYCGSYLGYGFHEDAIRSGLEVAHRFGLDL